MYLRTSEGLGQGATPRESAELAERLGLAEPKVDEAAQYESIVAKVRAQLERPFQDPNDPRLYERRKEMVRLFGLVPPSFAKTLYERLHSEDPLGRLFRYRLATPTRKQLLGILLSAPSVGPQKPQVSPGPIQPGPPQPGPRPPWLPWPVWPWPWPPRPPQSPQPPQPPEPPVIVIDPGWRPPRLPLPDLSPKEILDRAKEVLEFLKRNNGERKFFIPSTSTQSLIQKIENLLWEAAPIISRAGAVLGLYVFAKGRLVQMIAATRMDLPRILRRFEASVMKNQLERILGELTDPKMTRAVEEEVRKAQRRGPTGKFEKKQPGDEPPGSQHERAVCELVRRRFPFFAEQMKIKRFAPRSSFPGQPPSPALVLSDPPVKVDCIGSMSPTSGLVLFEAKESGPPDFSNPGLTAGQRIVYPALVEYGGALVVSKGSFAAGTRLPSGTRVRIITPANLDDI